LMSSFTYKIIVVNFLIVAKIRNVIIAIITSISLVANKFKSLNLECKFNF